MRVPKATFWTLENLGQERLSKNFQFRQFLYSEIAIASGISNMPDDPELAIDAGRKLCEHILEPICEMFGPIIVRSGYRSCEVNGFGHRNRWKVGSNESNYAYHIWDRYDAYGNMGAAACIIVPAFNAGETQFKHWQDFAWYLDEKLDHNGIGFFKRDFAFNIGWATDGDPTIYSTRTDGSNTLRNTKRSKEERQAAKDNPHPPTRQGGLV